MHLEGKRQGCSKVPRGPRGEKGRKQDKRTQSYHVHRCPHMLHCLSRWGAYSPGTVFPGRESLRWTALWHPAGHPRGCAGSSSCSPPRTGQDQPFEQSVPGKQRQNPCPKWGSSMRSVNTNPHNSSSPKSQSPQKIHLNHSVKDTNSGSPALCEIPCWIPS